MKKLKTKNQKLKTDRQKGFTLIEVLVYGVVFSLFLLLTVQVFVTIKTTSANSLSMVSLIENYTRIFFDLNQTIRGAQDVVSPTAGNSAASLSLNSGEIVYQVNNGVLEKVVGGQALALTDEGVSIGSATFTSVGEATQTASIKIQMTLDSNYLLESGKNLSEQLETTIGLR